MAAAVTAGEGPPVMLRQCNNDGPTRPRDTLQTLPAGPREAGSFRPDRRMATPTRPTESRHAPPIGPYAADSRARLPGPVGGSALLEPSEANPWRSPVRARAELAMGDYSRLHMCIGPDPSEGGSSCPTVHTVRVPSAHDLLNKDTERSYIDLSGLPARRKFQFPHA